jgi:hypothetical protein
VEEAEVAEPAEAAAAAAAAPPATDDKKDSGEAAVDGTTATTATATTLSAAAAAAAASEKSGGGRYKEGGVHGPTAPLEKDAELYTPMQINVPEHTGTVQSETAEAQKGGTTEGDNGEKDDKEVTTATRKVTKFCKLVVEGVEHFVTIPSELAPGESFVRSLPKAFDSVTLRTLDTGELKMWLQQRGVRQATVGAKDEQATE